MLEPDTAQRGGERWVPACEIGQRVEQFSPVAVDQFLEWAGANYRDSALLVRGGVKQGEDQVECLTAAGLDRVVDFPPRPPGRRCTR